MAIVQVNPHSNEIRYTLGLMMYHLHAARPRSIRIASHSPEMVKSVVRHLCYEDVALAVENSSLQATVAESLGVQVGVVGQAARADAALFPFSLEEGLRPAGERVLVAACTNGLSYKSLRYPLSVRKTALGTITQLKPTYRLRPVAGLYSPDFIARLALAKLFERWDSARYFRLEERAMRRLIETGPLWRLSYLVVFTGQYAA
jgi:hypothetical protein